MEKGDDDRTSDRDDRKDFVKLRRREVQYAGIAVQSEDCPSVLEICLAHRIRCPERNDLKKSADGIVD